MVPAGTTRYLVPVVRSAFRILEELSREGALGLHDLTQRSGIAKSTVFRILNTLHHLGYLIRDERRNYHISSKIADLACADAGIEALRGVAVPVMLKLRDQFGETVNLGQLRWDKVVYVEVVPSEFALRLSERPGASVPAHATALGKAILAFSPPALVDRAIGSKELPALTRNTITKPGEFRKELRRVKERGFAWDRGETTLLATCVAAPILDAGGNAIAGMSISGPTSRFNPRNGSAVVKHLLQGALDIGRPFPG